MYKTLKYYIKDNLGLYFILGFLMVLSIGESVLSPWIISQIIDNAIEKKDILFIVYLCSIALTLYMISSVALVISQKTSTKIERRITIKIREKCMNVILEKTGYFYTNLNSSDILVLFMQDIDNLSSMLSHQIVNIFFDVLMIIGISSFLIYTYWKLAITTFLVIIVLLVIQKKLRDRIESATEESRNSAIELQRPIQEMITNLFSVILTNLGDYEKSKIRDKEEKFAQTKIKTAGIMAEYSSTLNLISGILVVIIIGTGSVQVIKGTMSIGVLMAFQIYSQKLLSPLSDLSNISASFAAAQISYNRINRFLSEYTQNMNNNNKTIVQSGNITFENVSFGYKTEEMVLKNINFKIKNGRTYAFVGESGAGKSTIVNLLFGLWSCTKGRILIDGKDILDFNIKELRKSVCIVSQNVFLLDDTIYKNIILDDEKPDVKKVIAVLQKAEIWNYVNGLPNGLNSEIGENGVRLSGGERQRISIARALYRNAKIIIFDEATSMLDNETENQIIHTVLELFKGKTIIMIAHRLTTVRNANTIFVIQNGEIVETGNHQNLIEKKGVYYNLYCYQK